MRTDKGIEIPPEAGVIYSLKVAAEQLAVTPATLRQQIAAGRLRAFKSYGIWFVTERALEDYRFHSLAQPGRKRRVTVRTDR